MTEYQFAQKCKNDSVLEKDVQQGKRRIIRASVISLVDPLLKMLVTYRQTSQFAQKF